jgi:phage terminase large subunit
MSKPLNDEGIELLVSALGLESEVDDPDWPAGGAQKAWEAYKSGWRPRLNPTQQLAFDNHRAKYILMDGERGSGKTDCGLDMLVDHCFNNFNALALIIVREAGMSKDGGAWDKLINWILPKWKKGNRNPKTRELYDNGIGLCYTEPKLDYETKKPYVWIGNRHGGWSMVRCISFPVDAHVEDKIKGKEASFILVDEAQTTQSDAYFTHLIQQVGRRHGIEFQPVVYTANPEGPSHWLYKKFFVDPVKEDGTWDDDFARYHVPITENIQNIPDGYYDRVMSACRSNQVLMARLVRGEWLDMPKGEAIFRYVFSPMLHVRPWPVTLGQGLSPVPGHPIIAGYDLGPAHSSIHFMQLLTLVDRNLWFVFDEINYVGQYCPYKTLVPIIMDRMDYWEAKTKQKFAWEHISDDSAFNQIRGNGSYDAAEVEKHSAGRIVMRAAPKGIGSVAARIRILMELCEQEEIMVSSFCTHTINMFSMMESGKDGLTPREDDPHKHCADSLSYPIITYLHGSKAQALLGPQSKIIVCGRGQAG